MHPQCTHLLEDLLHLDGVLPDLPELVLLLLLDLHGVMEMVDWHWHGCGAGNLQGAAMTPYLCGL